MTPSNERFEFDCTDLAVVLSGYLDDELPPGPRLAADRHLVICAACRSRVDEMETLDRLVAAEADDAKARFETTPRIVPEVAASSEIGLPDGFADGVLGRTHPRRQSSSASGRSVLVAWSGWLAAAAALAFAVTTLNRPLGPRPEAPGFTEAADAVAWDRARATLASGVLRSTTLDPAVREATMDDAPDDDGDGDLRLRGPRALDRWDAQTLAQTAFVLRSLALGGDDAESARSIAEYDELAGRLGEVAPVAVGDLQTAIEEAMPIVTELVTAAASTAGAETLTRLADRLDEAARAIDAAGAI